MAVLKALRRNPVLFVPVLVWTFVQVPELLIREVSPLLASAVSPGRSAFLLFATPFFHAGLVGMADEALDGYTSLDTFLRAGKDNYVSVLAVYLLLVAANSLLFVGLVVGAVVGGLLYLSGDGRSNLVALATVGVLVALVLAAYLLALFLVQFYGHAIVIDDVGAVDGLERSVDLVRHDPLHVLGYSVLSGTVGTLFALGVVLSSLLLVFRNPTAFGPSLPQFSPAGIGIGVVSIVLLQTLVGGTFATYSVSFYRTISG